MNIYCTADSVHPGQTVGMSQQNWSIYKANYLTATGDICHTPYVDSESDDQSVHLCSLM